ncbi:alpha/beta fold hydrolase [Amycolatopsis jejuensis]|uniref:alpha/beta fold hydrolase n=1 Tax=Amycolatopsis jejuensis TaxID=330084 RepID=UPI00068ECFA2|nr:alpha/beta hydrolase [Amycolatopsis jejuensis]
MATFTPHPELSVQLTDTGTGPPLLVLHGMAGPASVAPVAEHYAARYRVVIPVHPGWEGTARPEWFTGVNALADLYRDLLDDLDLAGVTVVGASFGGWVAAELAVRDRGQRISRLVLADAVGPRIPGHRLRPPAGPPGGGPPGGGPPPASAAALRAYTGGEMSDPLLLRSLGRVRIPVHFLWGEHDSVVTPEFGRAYAAAIPDASFHLIPGGGHLPLRDHPAESFAILDRLLAGNSPETP